MPVSLCCCWELCRALSQNRKCMRNGMGRLKAATTGARTVGSAFMRTVMAVAVLSAACATNPATGERQLSFMSEEKEIALGQENDVQVRQEMGSYDDRALQEYVSTVGMKLAQ